MRPNRQSKEARMISVLILTYDEEAATAPRMSHAPSGPR